jgi:hypothetical protein
MAGHELRVDTLGYYQKSLIGMLSLAKENGIKVGFRLSGNNTADVRKMDILFIDSFTGEVVEVEVWEKSTD